MPAHDAWIAEYDRLLGAIYEGTGETPPWRSTVAELKRQFGAEEVTIEIAAEAGVVLQPPCVESEPGVAGFSAAGVLTFDPFLALPPGSVMTARELAGPGALDDVRASLAALGADDILGADLYTDAGLRCRLRLTRRPGGGAFCRDDKERCRQLLPHIRRAVTLFARMDVLECERQLSAQAVERLLLGMVTFGARGQLLRMNQEARDILRQQDGIRLVQGRLIAGRAAEQLELQRLIRDALSDAPGGDRPVLVRAMLVTRVSGRAKLSIAVRAVDAVGIAGGGQRPSVVLYIRDPEHSSLASADTLMRLFRMTRAQATLAALLVQGMSMEEAAGHLQVSRNTLRSHLRELHAKVGVSRRTELVRILIGNGASLAQAASGGCRDD